MVNSGRKETRPIESGGKVKKARERTCLLLCGNMSPSFQTLIIPLVSVNHPQMEHECEEIQGPRVNKCAVFLPPHHTHNRHHEQPHGTEDTTRSHIGHTTRNTTAQNAQQNRQPTSKHATHSTTTRNTTQTQPCDTRTNGTKHTPHTKHNTHARVALHHAVPGDARATQSTRAADSEAPDTEAWETTTHCAPGVVSPLWPPHRALSIGSGQRQLAEATNRT